MILCGGFYSSPALPLSPHLRRRSLQTLKSCRSRILRTISPSVSATRKATLNLERFDVIDRLEQNVKDDQFSLSNNTLENLYYSHGTHGGGVATIRPERYCHKSARFCSVRSRLSRTERKKEMLKISAVKYLPGKRLPLQLSSSL